jgi:predicted PurR-regulated permease PerM
MKFDNIQQFFFFALLVVTTGLFLWMLGKYLFPVFWAIVFAVVFNPLYVRIERTFKGRSSTAALATILSVVLIVMIPLVFVGGLIVKESLDVYQTLTDESGTFDNASLLARTSQFTAQLVPFGISQEMVEERLRSGAAWVSQSLATSLVVFGQLTFSFFINTAIMLYLLFFFFRDGTKLQKLLIHYLPLGDENERRLFKRFTETTRAVVKGTLAIAALQGFIGGVTFALVGVANPVLWGVAMGLLAVVPAVGPALVWIPVGVILIATGSFWAGIIVLIVGALLVSLVDEFLRPILVGRGAQMPDALVLMATIGGLATFGITGFVVGPIVAAFFLSLWIIFEERYHRELNVND